MAQNKKPGRRKRRMNATTPTPTPPPTTIPEPAPPQIALAPAAVPLGLPPANPQPAAGPQVVAPAGGANPAPASNWFVSHWNKLPDYAKQLGAILLFNGLLLAVLAFVWDWRIKTEIDRRWQEFQKATTNYHKGLEYDHAMYGFQCNREYDAVVRTYRQMQRELGDFSALSPYVVQTVSEKLVNAFAKGITFNQLDRDEVAKLALILRDGSCGQIHYSVGICLLATKQFDDARRSFERAYAVPNSGDACGNANGAAFYFVITELADLNHKTADDKVNAAWARLGELVRKKSTSSLEVKQTLDALREDALIEHVIGFDPANTRPACDKLRDRLAKKILVLESGKVIEVDTPRIPPPPAAP